MHFGFGSMSGFNGMGWFGGFGMILFWIVLIAAVVILIRFLSKSNLSGRQNVNNDRPLEILKRRYAAGEITRSEYEQMKRALVTR